jgi:hypothetical protein
MMKRTAQDGSSHGRVWLPSQLRSPRPLAMAVTLGSVPPSGAMLRLERQWARLSQEVQALEKEPLPGRSRVQKDYRVRWAVVCSPRLRYMRSSGVRV